MIRMFNEVEEFKDNNLIQKHPHDLGYDIRAGEDKVVFSHSTCELYTGLHILMPFYFGGIITSRSGWAFKRNIDISTAGTIDPGFIGAVRIRLHNYGDLPQHIKKGDRIAQLIPILRVESIITYLNELVFYGAAFRSPFEEFGVEEVDISEWPETDRGETCLGDSGGC